MTGTALTEAEEFFDIYKLKTVSIPTNKKMIRIDTNDQVFRTEKEKYKAIIEKVEYCYNKNQPVLVGTTSIDKSEKISEMLKEKRITHNVLNAKQHVQEASIIAEAGKLNAVTIATNMAGRGTDIQLGGNLNKVLSENKDFEKKSILNEKKEILEKGGLFVVGTERHESRRIDNQLRGRSGRQGDPGESIFYISLEDDLMRIFGSESIDGKMKKIGLKEGESINHPWINKALERAQQRVEARNFDIRKTLLKFDDVMNDQRHVIFQQRNEILKTDNISRITYSFLEDLIKSLSNEKIIYSRDNQLDGFKKKIKPILGRSFAIDEIESLIVLKTEIFESTVKNKFNEFRDKRCKIITPEANANLEKRVCLQTIDFLWRAHLQHLEHLRQVVGLRGYAQKDPLDEFKRESFKLFEDLLYKIKFDLITFLNNVEVVPKKDTAQKDESYIKKKIQNNPNCLLVIKKNEKISRNEKCPSTGKKYKNCCGAI
jgi:preprotein translocase subunit SecA